MLNRGRVKQNFIFESEEFSIKKTRETKPTLQDQPFIINLVNLEYHKKLKYQTCFQLTKNIFTKKINRKIMKEKKKKKNI